MVIAGVIAGLVLAAIFKLFGFGWINLCIQDIIIFILKQISIPYYVLALIFVAGFILCLAILYLPKNIRQNLKDYIKDEVEGLIWAWGWSFSRNIVDLKSLCPNCQGELEFQDGYKKYYACICCNFEKEIKSRQNEFKHEIYIEIERRIRTGEWKLAKKRMKQLKK